jgi:hypothetical protein
MAHDTLQETVLLRSVAVFNEVREDFGGKVGDLAPDDKGFQSLHEDGLLLR